MKIYDPGLAHYAYCRDRQGQMNLLDLQVGAIGLHSSLGNDERALSLVKGAIFSALLLTMSHAMEKGGEACCGGGGIF